MCVQDYSTKECACGEKVNQGLNACTNYSSVSVRDFNMIRHGKIVEATDFDQTKCTIKQGNLVSNSYVGEIIYLK